MSNAQIRLQLYLSRSGIASRRKCETFITQGRVKVNGKIITQLGTKVTAKDTILFDDKQVEPEITRIYVALHKPVGYLCSHKDTFKRKLAIDLLRPYFSERLFSVGRLDYMTSGLVFFTNDGDFAGTVSHPSFRIEKEYVVSTKQDFPDICLQKYQAGLNIHGVNYTLKRYKRIEKKVVLLILEEGKNREIRKVLEFFRLNIKSIHRSRIGVVNLNGIAPGSFRHLTEDEIDYFTNRGKD